MILYCIDEASSDSRGDLFVFGGITVSDSAISGLVNIIDSVKKSFTPVSIPREVEIKWNYQKTQKVFKKSTGMDLTREQHTDLKAKILNEVSKLSRDDIGIVLYVAPYKFYLNNGWQSYQMAMNVCLGKFQGYLDKKNQQGVCLIDELEGIKTRGDSGEDVVLSKAKLRGQLLYYIMNLYENGTGKVTIPRIPIIMPNTISTLSNLHQINDLVLGAFQYYLQCFNKDGEQRSKAVNTLKKIIRNFHVNFESPDKIAALSCGINIYPQRLNNNWSSELKEAYQLLPLLKLKLNEDFKVS